MAHGAMIGLGGGASLMLRGYVWPVYTSQTGPRGDDKFAKPAVLETSYASNPMGYTRFARFSLGD